MYNPQPNEIYRHFKGNLYRIITLAVHSETGERMVVYQALYADMQVYVRPLELFFSPVDREKYPQAAQSCRFELVKESVQTPAQPEQNPAQQPEENGGIDPFVMKFLESDTYEEKLDILASLHAGITDDMINTMAMAVDVEIEDGDLQERYEQLKTCLLTFDKFECSRLR